LSQQADDITSAMRSLRQAFLIGVEGVTEIWLVRHADVYEELEDVADPPLSRLGHQQAERPAAVVQRMQDAVDGAAAGVVRIKGDRRMAGPLCDIAHLEALP